jgi:hypothetical protein
VDLDALNLVFFEKVGLSSFPLIFVYFIAVFLGEISPDCKFLVILV